MPGGDGSSSPGSDGKIDGPSETPTRFTGPNLALSSSVSSNLPPISKLTGVKNWNDWKFYMDLYLALDKLDVYLRRDPDPTKPGELQADKAARGKVCLMVDPTLIGHVRNAKTCFEAWSSLCDVFENKDQSRLTLLYQLFDVKHLVGGSLLSYVMEFKDIVDNLKSTGKELDEELLGALVLRNLSPHYKWLRLHIEHSSPEDPSTKERVVKFEYVCQELMNVARKESCVDGSTLAAKRGISSSLGPVLETKRAKKRRRKKQKKMEPVSPTAEAEIDRAPRQKGETVL